MSKWDVTYSRLASMPEAIDCEGNYDDLEKVIQALAGDRKLEFDHFTDQVDVWSVRPNGRRDRFMILMAA